MKFSTKEDLAVPADVVFARLSDFAMFERGALRRGADVNRLDDNAGYGVGSEWQVAFQYRGKLRKIIARIASFEPSNGYRVDAAAGGIDAVSNVELVELSPKRTRVAVSLEMTPRTLSARLLIQSLKLGKSRLDQRFKSRVAEFTTDLEEQYVAGKL